MSISSTGLSRDERSGYMAGPLLVTVRNGKALLGVGHTTLYAMIKAGALDVRKIGRRTLLTMESIRRVAAEGAKLDAS